MAGSPTIATWGWFLASFAYVGIWLGGYRLTIEEERTKKVRLDAALLATALAAATRALAELEPAALVLARPAQIFEPFAWTLALSGWAGNGSGPWSALGSGGRRLLALAVAAVLFALALEPEPGFWRAGAEAVLALAGFLALAMVLRALDEVRFWQLKYLLAGVVAILAFDLVSALGDLSGGDRLAAGLDLPEALATFFAAPLVLVSLRRLRDTREPGPRLPGIAAGGLAAGLVTLYGALVGWLAFESLRLVPGLGPGLVFAAALFAVLALGLLAASGTVRAFARKFSGRLSGERFDYEREWLRFLDTVTGEGAAAEEELPLRVIRAIAEAVDATGGAIWLHRGDDRFELVAIRNLERPRSPLVDVPGLSALLGRLDEPIELERLAAVPGPPGWAERLPRPPRGWLFLPLVHRGRPFGFVVLAAPRACRQLDPAEKRLLRILAREAASYLAEDRATRALAEAQQFSAFGRRFAFLVHDLKNLLAELALAADNARRHMDDPAFRRDLRQTLDESVVRLRRLLERLRENGLPSAREPVDLVPLLAQARGSRLERRPRLVARVARLPARIDPERLLAALRHLLDNAFEATEERGPVELRLRREGELAIIEVIDGGPGLPAEASGGAAFRPFVTTKPKGLGIGLAAAREHVESLGGRLELESRPGRGTTARILLPLTEPIG
ncbi:MAG: PEP-CTERM system histidine kinase PrsK [Geminicoccaceae bacterium]|nr:PEP-CTERM system histidine kinase PrsK [Geminicoccaceae bacterium]